MCHDNHLLSPENISIQYLCHSGLWDVAEQVWTSSTVVIVMLVNLNSRNIIWPIVLYLPQPAWICAASASYWLIRIPNQAARRYLLHVPWWWASSFIFFPSPPSSCSLFTFCFWFWGSSLMLIIFVIWHLRLTSKLSLSFFFFLLSTPSPLWGFY